MAVAGFGDRVVSGFSIVFPCPSSHCIQNNRPCLLLFLFCLFFSPFPPSCVAQDPIVRDVAAKLRQLSPDALVINLGNLAEELMLFAVGVDNVGAAFVHCF